METEDLSMETTNIEVSCLNTSEIKKILKGMSRGKVGGADGLLSDLIKDEGNFLLEKLAVVFTKCLQTYPVPLFGK